MMETNGDELPPDETVGADKVGGLARPLHLSTGETRTFAENGDELTLRASAHRDGFATLGFGDGTGIVAG